MLANTDIAATLVVYKVVSIITATARITSVFGAWQICVEYPVPTDTLVGNTDTVLNMKTCVALDAEGIAISKAQGARCADSLLTGTLVRYA